MERRSSEAQLASWGASAGGALVDSSAPLTFGMVDVDGREDALLAGVAYFAGGASLPGSSLYFM